MRRDQTFHELLIPLLVNVVGARSYLEFGTHLNETISRVQCEKRYGVDVKPAAYPGITMLAMTTAHFIRDYAQSLAPFDFVFLDADHSADAVRRDFEGIWPYVSMEGLILCHDTNPETEADTAPGLCGDAWLFAHSVRETVEAVTLPYHPGLTIIRKRLGWGPRS